MSNSLLSFLPEYVVKDLIVKPDGSPLEGEKRIRAVILFADVSGFTAISEALGKTGTRGTEELTGILNSYFDPMIALIRSYGGIIGKFGGDAMTVLFPYIGETASSVVENAIHCALQMQANMDRYAAIPTSAGEFSLAMKAGLSMGPVLLTNVGESSMRLEYLIAGQALDAAADSEHHATKGEVVVHAELLNHTDKTDILEMREGFACIKGLRDYTKPTIAEAAPTAVTPALTETLGKFLHPSIAGLLKANRTEFINEHRRVTVLFVSFSGFDYDNDPKVSDALQKYLSSVIRIIHRYDGYLNKVDMGDKGSKYIVLFGAPIAHENDEERALRCAFELSRLPDISARIGVNTGFVFCGQVGSSIRQEYTVMGDAVNLSARLMQAAQPGQIVVSDFTRRRYTDLFEWQERDAITVKGKSEPIDIANLTGIHADDRSGLHEPSYDLPLVGRKQELATIDADLDAVMKGSGRVIRIKGEAGVGKSRLTAEVMNRAREKGLKVFGGACASHAASTAYYVWRPVWINLLDLPSIPQPEGKISHLVDLLSMIGTVDTGLVSLMAPLLNLTINQPESLSTLDAQTRQEMLHSLMLGCLRWFAETESILIVLEDVHWIDALSEVMLDYLARNLSDIPVALLIVTRPPTSQQEAAQRAFRVTPHTEIDVNQMELEDARQLIEHKHSRLFPGVPLDGDFAERITTHTGGNPFYIEALFNYLHDRSEYPDNVDNLQKLPLPDSLHKLIVSRVDQLVEQDKLTLKVASVIGRLFKAHWVWGSYDGLGTLEEVEDRLQHLDHMDIIALDRPVPELEYLFRHVLTQEIIYENLAYATRQKLHESIGAYIEKHHEDFEADYLNILAYHYGFTENKEKKRYYFRKAADAAKAAFANEIAVNFYEQLLPLVEGEERAYVLRALGQIQEHLGQWQEAEASYKQGMETVPEGSLEHTRCQSQLGFLYISMKSPAEGEELLIEAVSTFEKLGDQEALITALKNRGHAVMLQGRYDEAMELEKRRLRLAEETDNQIEIAEAKNSLSIIYRDTGDFETAQQMLEDAMKIAEESNFPLALININNDMAGLYYFQADYRKAINYCVRALETARSISFRQGSGQTAQNVGEIYRGELVYPLARKCFAWALHLFYEIGDLSSMSYALGSTGELMLQSGEEDLAQTALDTAVKVFTHMNMPFILCTALRLQASLLRERGVYIEAETGLDKAMEAAKEAGRQDEIVLIQLERIKLQQELGLLGDAETMAAHEKVLAEAEAENDQAMVNYLMWKLDPTRTEFKEKAKEIYKDLYKQTPNRMIFDRIVELYDGKRVLSPPPPLPDLPDFIDNANLSLETLLERCVGFVEKSLDGAG